MVSRFRHWRFRRYGAKRLRTFEEAAREPEAAFARLWEETYRSIGESPFWRARGLAARLEDNPTTDYEDYRPAFETAFAEKISPLNGEAILNWAVSSGSSGPPKKFPITDSYAEQMHDFHVQFFYNYLRRYPRFLRTPLFYLAAHGPMAYSPTGIPVSYISNFNYRKMPLWLQKFFGVPLPILKDEETSAHWRPLYVLATDASAFMSATPSVVIALLKQIERRGPELYAYLSGERALPPELPPLRVSEARLRQLEQAGLRSGAIDFQKIWPGMEFAGCWTDAVCKLQAIELRRVLGPRIPVVEMPFSATEAWATIPRYDDKPGGAIHAASLLVEFGPVGVKSPGKLLRPWELREGEEYELYVTNRMGLVRYRMFDIVRCTGHYRRVAEISFLRKSSQEISLGLVCVSETELIRSLEPVESLRGKRVFFSPNETGRGLTLFVESREQIPAEIAARVYHELAKLNPSYREVVQAGEQDGIDVRAIDPAHTIWKLSHAQSKPYLIRHTRPELE